MRKGAAATVLLAAARDASKELAGSAKPAHLVWHSGAATIPGPAFAIRTADHPLDSATSEALASARIVARQLPGGNPTRAPR